MTRDGGAAARILVAGAGAASSVGFARSLRASSRGDHLIGTNASAADLMLADVDERYVLPHVDAATFEAAFERLLELTRPDFVHVQSDPEVRKLSRLRATVEGAGATLFLPDHDAIVICQDKWLSYERWRDAGIPLPETRVVKAPDELDRAFANLAPELWLRERCGAGGAGSLRTRNRELAHAWIDDRGGWGRFTAAVCLTDRTVTWQSVWFEGELVVAQTRRRRGWAYGRNAPTGVSGITGIGETCSDPVVDRTAERAIRAVSARPHGIYGVDMAFDGAGIPNPTEINVGRFFTTHEFFTRAGLNLPEIYVTLGVERRFPELETKLNPLPDGLVWIRSMDVEPVLTTAEELEALAVKLDPSPATR